MIDSDVIEATHVRCMDGSIRRIIEKWGVGQNGTVNRPSEGGFGVVTEDGTRISMWHARSYLKEEGKDR